MPKLSLRFEKAKLTGDRVLGAMQDLGGSSHGGVRRIERCNAMIQVSFSLPKAGAVGGQGEGAVTMRAAETTDGTAIGAATEEAKADETGGIRTRGEVLTGVVGAS